MNELVAKGASLGLPAWVGLVIGALSVVGFVILAIIYGGREGNGAE